jgi:hypothetical protein
VHHDTGQSKYKIHLGTENQEPDGLIVRKVLEETGEADAVRAYRGLVYRSPGQARGRPRPPTTVGGVKYWLACHTNVSVNSPGSNDSNQNDARRLIAQSYASGLPDPFGSGSSYSNTRGMKMLVWTNPT